MEMLDDVSTFTSPAVTIDIGVYSGISNHDNSNTNSANTNTRAKKSKKKKKKRARTRHATLTQIRAWKPVWNFYFAPKIGVDGKKKQIGTEERKKRWSIYQARMKKEFFRDIDDLAYTSEQTNMRRHSDALAYIRYVQVRKNKLDPSKLNTEQHQFYLEIGGGPHIDALIQAQNNIDSINKAAREAKQAEAIKQAKQNQSRKRTLSQMIEEDDVIDLNPGNNEPIVSNLELASIPDLESSSSNKHEPLLDRAVWEVRAKMDVHERRRLENIKLETFEITAQKLEAACSHMKTKYRFNPELIGAMTGTDSLDEQLKVAFDMWVSDNLALILHKTGDMDIFTQRVNLARQDQQEWLSFLAKWKLCRITSGDAFNAVWNLVAIDLGIAEVPGMPPGRTDSEFGNPNANPFAGFL